MDSFLCGKKMEKICRTRSKTVSLNSLCQSKAAKKSSSYAAKFTEKQLAKTDEGKIELKKATTTSCISVVD